MRPPALAAALLGLVLTCSSPWPGALAGVRVDLERQAGAAGCAHLTQLWAIDNRLQSDLDKGLLKVRCGPLRTRPGVVERELRVLRSPEHEAVAQLDRVTGHLWGLNIHLLPVPQLYPPKDGWPGFGEIEANVRREANLSPEARLKHIERVFDEQGGLLPGQRPYARLIFEHVVEGATVLGDRVVARLDLSSARLVELNAHPWHPAAAPERRVTLTRARRVAHGMLRRLAPVDVPCCHPTQEGQAAHEAIGDALAAEDTVDEVARKKLLRLLRHARITCPDLEERRIFAPDPEGRLTEAWQFRCVPLCRVKTQVRRCEPDQAVMVYVTTEKGRVMGMKGQLAPIKQNWKPGLPPSPAPLRDPVLERKARNALHRAVIGIEPTAEFTEVTCPQAELGARIFRMCWKLAFTAETWMGRVQGDKVSFVATSRSYMAGPR